MKIQDDINRLRGEVYWNFKENLEYSELDRTMMRICDSLQEAVNEIQAQHRANPIANPSEQWLKKWGVR